MNIPKNLGHTLFEEGIFLQILRIQLVKIDLEIEGNRSWSSRGVLVITKVSGNWEFSIRTTKNALGLIRDPMRNPWILGRNISCDWGFVPFWSVWRKEIFRKWCEIEYNTQ